MRAVDALLVTGLALRATRLVTTDQIGERYVQRPAYELARKHLDTHGAPPSWDWLRDGLGCPYCVGYWLGVGALVSERATRNAPGPVRGSWRLLAGSFTLNYVVGHLSSRLDVPSED